MSTNQLMQLVSKAKRRRSTLILLNLEYSSEWPVNKLASKTTPICDLFGNVWQWCLDHFNPLPGFRVHKYYDDFSTPCFDGQHQMIMGGSFASTGDEASNFARFHFLPHFFNMLDFELPMIIMPIMAMLLI